MTYDEFKRDLLASHPDKRFTETQIAKLYAQLKPSISQTKKIPTGNCMDCDIVKERIVVIPVEICMNCFERIGERNNIGEKLVLERKELCCDKLNPKHCYLCNSRLKTVIKTHIRACPDCIWKRRSRV